VTRARAATSQACGSPRWSRSCSGDAGAIVAATDRPDPEPCVRDSDVECHFTEGLDARLALVTVHPDLDPVAGTELVDRECPRCEIDEPMMLDSYLRVVRLLDEEIVTPRRQR
jgi:hypothetical protein